jgi:hypothetical protein
MAAITPLVCCAFFSPACAAFAVSSRHLAEWDEIDGKFVGTEDDTLLFDEDGALLGDDVYNPHGWEEESFAAALDALTQRHAKAAAPEAAPTCGAAVTDAAEAESPAAVPLAGASGLKEE